MTLIRHVILVASTASLLLLELPAFGQDQDASAPQGTQRQAPPTTREETQEQPIRISQVPSPALSAAKRELGTQPTQAKVLVGTSPQAYELQAQNRAGQITSVFVLANGQVLTKETL